MIIPSMGDSNHPVMYQEYATTVEDLGLTVQQAEAIHLLSAVQVSDTSTSSPSDMNFRTFLESMEHISKTQDTLPS
jgi:hypothetical protein